jgi:hypothetical protein
MISPVQLCPAVAKTLLSIVEEDRVTGSAPGLRTPRARRRCVQKLGSRTCTRSAAWARGVRVQTAIKGSALDRTELTNIQLLQQTVPQINIW